MLRVDPITGNATLEIGKNEAVLPKAEQVPGEELVENSLIKIFVVDVKDGSKGPKIMISRTHRVWCAACLNRRCRRSLTVPLRLSLSLVRPAPVPRSPYSAKKKMWIR